MSRPIWWLRCPDSIGPPRGWLISPIYSPFQPFCRALVDQDDPHAGIEERQFPQAAFQRFKGIVEIGKRIGRGHEPHFGSGAVARVGNHLEVFDRIAMFKPGDVLFARTPDPQFQPVTERVHNRHANAVQAARDLVGVAVEFAARVQLGHDDFGRRNALFLVDADRNAATVVRD